MNGMSIGGVFRRVTTVIIVMTAIILVIIFYQHRTADEFESIFNQRDHLIDQKSKSDQNLESQNLPNIKLPSKCTSGAKIVFLKTHKTASSTIQNILMRWGTKVR